MIEKLTVDRILKMLECTPEQCLFDWKRDLAYNTEDKKSEVVKDIVAIANAAGNGPGYVFYGVDPDHPDRILGMTDSYDDSRFQQLVKGKVDPLPEFLFYPLTHEGKTIGVMHVAQSSHRPHVIVKDFGKLREGQILIRRGSSTAGASQADLQEMARSQGGSANGVQTPYVDAFRSVVKSEMSQAGLQRPGNLEQGVYYFWHCPLERPLALMVHRLRGHMQNAELPNNGLPMGLTSLGKYQAREDTSGLRMYHKTDRGDINYEYWYLHGGGGLFLMRSYDEARGWRHSDKTPKPIAYNVRVWRAAEAIEHCIRLYDDMGMAPGETLYFEFTHDHLQSSTIVAAPPYRFAGSNVKPIRKMAKSQWEGTLGELKANRQDVGLKFINDLLATYEVPAMSTAEYDAIHGEFMKSRVGRETG